MYNQDPKFNFFKRNSPADIAEATYDIYSKIFMMLAPSNPHINRVWNFIPKIESTDSYIKFNEGRQEAFSRFKYEYSPVSTAVGTEVDQLAIYVEYGHVKPIYIDNPQQIHPENYPHKYGSPIFSRAQLIYNRLYISGTASIIGSDSVYPDNIFAQIPVAMRNIFALIQKANTITGKSLSAKDLVYVAYIDPLYFNENIKRMIRYYVNGANISFQKAHICRPELLVEIEAKELSSNELRGMA